MASLFRHFIFLIYINIFLTEFEFMFISVKLFVFPLWSLTCNPGHVVVLTLGDIDPLQEGLLLPLLVLLLLLQDGRVCWLTWPSQAAQIT